MAKYLTLVGLQTFYAGLKTKLNGKVDVEEGKGLSEVNVTQTMVDGWNAAEKNVITGVKVRKGDTTSDLTVDDDRNVTVEIPDKFSDLTNDLEGDNELLNQKFYTETIAPAIAAVKDGSLAIAIVTTLPAGTEEDPYDPTKIYFVPKEGSSEDDNVYDEYMVVTKDGAKSLEKIGETKIDLSGYVLKADIEVISDDEIADILKDEDNAD
jgi:hypothetical protein